MSLNYILSLKRLLLPFGALHAEESGPSFPIMMHHHQANNFPRICWLLANNVPESIIELNEVHYILT